MWGLCEGIFVAMVCGEQREGRLVYRRRTEDVSVGVR